MKQVITKALIVVLGFALIDIIVLFACNTMYDMLDNEEFCRDGDVAAPSYHLNSIKSDVIITGSSPAFCGFDSELISDSLSEYYQERWTVSNIAAPRQRMPWIYATIMSAIDRKPPKVIIMDVCAFWFSIDEVEGNGLSTLRPQYYRNKYAKEILDEYDDKKELFVYRLSSIYRFRSNLFQLPFQFMKPKGGDAYEVGYNVMDSTEIDRTIHKSTAKADTSVLKYLDAIITACKKNNVTLLVTITPELFYSDTQCKGYQMFAKICAEHNIKIYDMSSHPDFTDYHFYKDNGHLNSYGAEKYSPIIARIIEQNYQIE